MTGSAAGSVEARATLPRDVGSKFIIPMLIMEPSRGMFHVCEGHLRGCIPWEDLVVGAGWEKVRMVD